MAFYERITPKFEAYQWLGPDVPEGRQFPRGFYPTIFMKTVADKSNHWLRQSEGGIMFLLSKGDYILKDSSGMYSRLNPDVFAEQFKALT